MSQSIFSRFTPPPFLQSYLHSTHHPSKVQRCIALSSLILATGGICVGGGAIGTAVVLIIGKIGGIELEKRARKNFFNPDLEQRPPNLALLEYQAQRVNAYTHTLFISTLLVGGVVTPAAAGLAFYGVGMVFGGSFLLGSLLLLAGGYFLKTRGVPALQRAKFLTENAAALTDKFAYLQENFPPDIRSWRENILENLCTTYEAAGKGMPAEQISGLIKQAAIALPDEDDFNKYLQGLIPLLNKMKPAHKYLLLLEYPRLNENSPSQPSSGSVPDSLPSSPSSSGVNSLASSGYSAGDGTLMGASSLEHLVLSDGSYVPRAYRAHSEGTGSGRSLHPPETPIVEGLSDEEGLS